MSWSNSPNLRGAGYLRQSAERPKLEGIGKIRDVEWANKQWGNSRAGNSAMTAVDRSPLGDDGAWSVTMSSRALLPVSDVTSK
jgi:hypothetical protein